MIRIANDPKDLLLFAEKKIFESKDKKVKPQLNKGFW